ncbi:hypothetical protein E2I00_018637 [Balaenoptera physalus]|uniref:SURP motif domain-containing protein n=1 Tax=Balaenoptera physalus TaxID=9770 RepID=A0A6A1QHC5_BALPH|nr:hypothetical protein E2I00_018637 [Balaenoptera physalus]
MNGQLLERSQGPLVAYQELRNVIDKLAQFVARNGPEFEKMTMEKQKDNPKFSFLFGGEFYSYYKCKLALEQQQLICKQQAPELEAATALPPLPQPPLAPAAPIPPAQGTPSMDELIQQSQWNLQQQEQHLLALRQEQVTAAVAHAVEQQMQKLLEETQLDMNEFDNLLQPIIDTCTKDAISLLQLWEKNGYFDDSIIQQLQSPALGLGQYQIPGSSEYDASGGVQDPAATGPRGPGPHDQIPPNKPPWFDQPHPVAPWGQQQGDFQAEMGPPHHHPGHRMPHPGINEHPPWGGPQHPDFGPPPHGFNGQPPHMRRQGPPHINHDDPSLVPNVPYFDLPAGLMAPLVKLEDHEYKPLDPKDIRLPPPMPPSERLLAAVEAFYSPPSHDRPRNSEGWEQNGLYEFFRAKMRARRRKGQEKRNRLGEENKGHQMLVKMGWSGSGGLGVKEQGIQDPIKGGDVRDKWDQYKGVGVALDDPYENYRRNKSYSFIARMKARDECK